MKKITIILALLFMANFSYSQNLLDISNWKIGTGNAGAFNANGLTSENSRVWGIGPDGKQCVLWKSQPDGSVDPDGGWNHDFFAIDHTSMYRFTVWMKKTNSNDGLSHFGTFNVNNLDGTVNTNPYFWVGDLPELNKWFLLIGYVHGSGDISTTSYGGIYDGISGERVVNLTDYKFDVTTTTTNHRTYLFYDPNTSDEQFFYAPRVELVNGNEPSVTELLGFGYKPGTLAVRDTRTIVPVPNTYSKSLGLDFKEGLRLGLPGTYYTTLGIRSWEDDSGGKAHELAFSNDTPSQILFRSGLSSGWEGWRSLLISDENGNYGIGTTTPDAKLAVNGTIHAREVKVDVTGFPDYVFDDDYRKASLAELEKYIKINRHLPNVPTAKEVEANGLELGEMNKILLKKIEELTLHLIEKEKDLNVEKEENKRQNQRLEKLEKLLSSAIGQKITNMDQLNIKTYEKNNRDITSFTCMASLFWTGASGCCTDERHP